MKERSKITPTFAHEYGIKDSVPFIVLWEYDNNIWSGRYKIIDGYYHQYEYVSNRWIDGRSIEAFSLHAWQTDDDDVTNIRVFTT